MRHDVLAVVKVLFAIALGLLLSSSLVLPRLSPPAPAPAVKPPQHLSAAPPRNASLNPRQASDGEAGSSVHEFRPGVVLTRLRPGLEWRTMEANALSLKATRKHTIPNLNIHILSVPIGKELEVSRKLSALPDVLYAEPDYLLWLQSAPAPAPTSTLPAPTLVTPPHGSVSASFSIPLAWSSPPGAQVFHVQVVPANNDGPGVNLIRVAADGFTLPPPPQWFGLLPGMTYTWRIRVNDTATWAASHPGWSPWSETWSFRTPLVSSGTIALVSPVINAQVRTTAPTLRWSNNDSNVFYYEVQMSTDPTFNADPATATAAVYWVLLHGGVTDPTNSYTAPSNYPLSLGATYHWRVRPRVQGDGEPLSWSPTWAFSVTPSGSLRPTVTPTPTPSPTPIPPPTASRPPNDPYYPLQWSLAKINAQAAWSVSAGSPSMIVAVVDTGVDLGHPDLSGRLVAGYNCVKDGAPLQDDHGHGTHVAGTIAATANNGVGVVGVAWGVKIMPVKGVGQLRKRFNIMRCEGDTIRGR